MVRKNPEELFRSCSSSPRLWLLFLFRSPVSREVAPGFSEASAAVTWKILTAGRTCGMVNLRGFRDFISLIPLLSTAYCVGAPFPEMVASSFVLRSFSGRYQDNSSLQSLPFYFKIEMVLLRLFNFAFSPPPPSIELFK